MAELSAADVEAYTNGRLTEDDPEVKRMLAAALQVARQECGWHVSPVRTAVSLTLDGPNSRILWLPTMKVVALTSITEGSTLLNPTTISLSAGDGPDMPRRAALRKTGASWWSAEYGSIHVVMDHGFTEVEAVDWRQAVLSMVDQMALLPVNAATGTSDFGLQRKQVDDVRYQWGPQYSAMAEDVLFSVTEILASYRLPSVEYF